MILDPNDFDGMTWTSVEPRHMLGVNLYAGGGLSITFRNADGEELTGEERNRRLKALIAYLENELT